MIIFDLDGTLADCEHRRHFVDPGKLSKWQNSSEGDYYTDGVHGPKVKWKPDWKSFYESCDQDKPIESTIELYLSLNRDFDGNPTRDIQIWSGRCESVRGKTIKWLNTQMGGWNEYNVKMRPIGDNTPDDQLKERWLDEYLNMPRMGTASGNINRIDFVFDDRPKVIRMWRRRGIFVFNCCQHDEEF